MNTIASTVDERKMREILERIIMDGRKPNVWEVHELGLDVKYLEKVVDRVKGQLWKLPAFRPLKDTAHTGRPKTLQRRFTEVSCADVPCVRITRKSYDMFSSYDRPFYYPLLGLNPKGDLSHRAKQDIELFITGRGEWILYRGSELSDENSFTLCRTVDELNTYLTELCGETHVLSPSKEVVLVQIANWLINAHQEEIDRLKKDLTHHEATLAECLHLQERMNLM